MVTTLVYCDLCMTVHLLERHHAVCISECFSAFSLNGEGTNLCKLLPAKLLLLALVIS